MKKTPFKIIASLMTLIVFSPNAWSADKVNITPHMGNVDIVYQGKKVRIERNQDQEHKLTNSFSKTSRKCPPFCIQPTTVAPDVDTVSEIDIIYFLVTHVKDKTGLLVDARVESFYKKGTIPGSVNLPFTIFSKGHSDPELLSALEKMGVTVMDNGEFNFTDAKPLILWCNGPWCGQSPRAIKGLLAIGYPASQLHYYRGGMQMWQILGLTTVEGK